VTISLLQQQQQATLDLSVWVYLCAFDANHDLSSFYYPDWSAKTGGADPVPTSLDQGGGCSIEWRFGAQYVATKLVQYVSSFVLRIMNRGAESL
jgi:hypothetical protein